jgi:hypothetical protein
LNEKSKLTETKKGETGGDPSQECAHHLFNLKGIIHEEFIIADKTVNLPTTVTIYGECVKICQHITLNFGDENWLFHYDNALSHTSFFTREFLTSNARPPHPQTHTHSSVTSI